MREERATSHRRLAIGEVASRAGIAVSAVRFYADRGLIRATRGSGGRREFDAHVLRRIGFVQVAQRVGLTLDEIEAALDGLPTDHAPTPDEWAELASTWRPLLDHRIRLLEALRDNLDGCIGCGCLSLDACNLRNPDDEVAVRGAGPRHLLES